MCITFVCRFTAPIDFVVFIPDFQLSTEKARAALPKTIDHHDAVYNLARAALLAGSLTTGKLETLMRQPVTVCTSRTVRSD